MNDDDTPTAPQTVPTTTTELSDSELLERVATLGFSPARVAAALGLPAPGDRRD